MLEGMATGVPVVSTRVGMAPDVMLDGENGFIVDVEDADGLAKAASNLIDSPELRSRRAQNGLTTAAEFDWTITATRSYDPVREPSRSHWGRACAHWSTSTPPAPRADSRSAVAPLDTRSSRSRCAPPSCWSRCRTCCARRAAPPSSCWDSPLPSRLSTPSVFPRPSSPPCPLGRAPPGLERRPGHWKLELHEHGTPGVPG